MRLELDFPHNFPELFIHTFHDIYHKLTQGLHTELIPLDQAIGRRVAEDILALQAYPAKHLAAIEGYGIESQKTEGINAKNYLKINHMYFWHGELYRSQDIYKINYNGDSVISLPKNFELPPSIDAIVSEDDRRLDFENPSLYKVLSPIEKFEGVIQQGSIIQQGECLLKKDESINAEKIMALSRAGVKEVNVYKKLRVVVVSLYSYDREDHISEECIYVKNTLQQWGYADVGIKILKPVVLVSPESMDKERNPIFDPTLGMSRQQLSSEFDQLASLYDLILVCSVRPSDAGMLTLRTMGAFQDSSEFVEKIRIENPNQFKIFKSNDRSPPIRENRIIRDAQGVHKGTVLEVLEDKAQIVNLGGDIDDIIISMNLVVRYILNRTDPKIVEHHYHRGFMENVQPSNSLQIFLAKYQQDISGKYRVNRIEDSQSHQFSKYTESNCIAIVPNQEQAEEVTEIFFLKLD
ncbi:MAG: hypothetical protein KA474_06115 [Acinetobacter sp.]|nr:hypothetical protein [Acinetobacter sp.]